MILIIRIEKYDCVIFGVWKAAFWVKKVSFGNFKILEINDVPEKKVWKISKNGLHFRGGGLLGLSSAERIRVISLTVWSVEGSFFPHGLMHI